MRVELVVDSGAAGQRLDAFLAPRVSLSRAALKALIDDGRVRVDGRRAKKGLALTEGQRVTAELPDAPPTAAADPSLRLTVLWEDEHLVFVDKPAGVPSQPLAPGELGTVANALVALRPEQAEVGADPREAGLAHRLDVETSGVLVAAKTKSAWTALRAAFGGAGREVDKRYLALVHGPLADEGEIDLPLAHHGDHMRPALGDAGARPARSEFTVKRRHGAAALVEVRILTGVLHQVRAHLAAIGAPIHGDTLYGGEADPALGRFFLHAARLTVPHPVSGHPVSVESPLPDALESVLLRLLGLSGPTGAREPQSPSAEG